jgi:thiol-disulfide isomerase/thioredoxin
LVTSVTFVMNATRLLRAAGWLGFLLVLCACRERATVTRAPHAQAAQVTSTQTVEAAKASKAAAMKPQTQAAALPIPDGIELLDAAGLRARLQLDLQARPQLRGTLLNVWASWCGSCKREIPMLLAMQPAFAEQGIDFVFLSADEPASFAAAREKMSEWAVPPPTLAIKAGTLGAVQRMLHPTWEGALPATFLFDASGKRRYFWEGPMEEHELTPILQAFVGGTLQDGEQRPALSAGKTDG